MMIGVLSIDWVTNINAASADADADFRMMAVESFLCLMGIGSSAALI